MVGQQMKDPPSATTLEQKAELAVLVEAGPDLQFRACALAAH